MPAHEPVKLTAAINEFRQIGKNGETASSDQEKKHIIVMGKGALPYMASVMGYESMLAFMQTLGRNFAKTEKDILAAHVDREVFRENKYPLLCQTVPFYELDG